MRWKQPYAGTRSAAAGEESSSGEYREWYRTNYIERGRLTDGLSN